MGISENLCDNNISFSRLHKMLNTFIKIFIYLVKFYINNHFSITETQTI